MNVVPIFEMAPRAAFLLFIIFSFAGWCAEVFYVGVFFEHKFINRGFLHGPLCPIYGCGGVAILLLPKQILSTWIPLFFFSMILCTAVEYFISWILEKIFHTLWWDYSHYKFNLNGRICLLNSVLFGLMGVLSVHFVIPLIVKFIDLLSPIVLTVSSDVIFIALSIDFIITVKRLVDFNATMAKIKTFAESLKDHYGHEEWFHSNSIEEMVASIKEHAAIEKNKINQNILDKIEKLQSHHSNVESFIKRFPTMKSVHYKDELKALKHFIKNRIKSEK